MTKHVNCMGKKEIKTTLQKVPWSLQQDPPSRGDPQLGALPATPECKAWPSLGGVEQALRDVHLQTRVQSTMSQQPSDTISQLGARETLVNSAKRFSSAPFLHNSSRFPSPRLSALVPPRTRKAPSERGNRRSILVNSGASTR